MKTCKDATRPTPFRYGRMFLLSVLMCAGCSPVQRDYERAVQSSTPKAYQSFLSLHAKDKLAEQLVWDLCWKYDSASACQDYLRRFPRGNQSALAQERLQDRLQLRHVIEIDGQISWAGVSRIAPGRYDVFYIDPDVVLHPRGNITRLTLDGHDVALLDGQVSPTDGAISTTHFGTLYLSGRKDPTSREVICSLSASRLQDEALEVSLSTPPPDQQQAFPPWPATAFDEQRIDEWPMDLKTTRFSPDGRRIALLRSDGDGQVVSVDAQRGDKYHKITDVEFSPDSKSYAYQGINGETYSLIKDGQVIASGPLEYGLHFAPSGGRLAYDSTEYGSDVPKGTLFVDGRKLASTTGSVVEVVFSPDGSRLAYSVKKDNVWQVCVDDRPSPLFEYLSRSCFQW